MNHPLDVLYIFLIQINKIALYNKCVVLLSLYPDKKNNPSTSSS